MGPAAFCRERLDAFARTGTRPMVLPFAVPGPEARGSHVRTFRSFP